MTEDEARRVFREALREEAQSAKREGYVVNLKKRFMEETLWMQRERPDKEHV